MKTLAEELRDDDERLRRRIVHATRPKHPLTMDDAEKLHRAMIESSEFVSDPHEK